MKLSERDRFRLRHMLDAARRAVRFAETRRRADLNDEDDPLVYALKHLITIVGEAAGEVSPEAREQLKELPWPDIVNMRHRIVHAYFDVSLDILWDTVQDGGAELT